MKIVILCQALLGFAALTAALPVAIQSSHITESSQQPVSGPLDIPGSEVELLSSDAPQFDEDLKLLAFENPDLFEGDIIISPEEIELYYGKQKNTHVRLKS